MINQIKSQLKNNFSDELVDNLISCYLLTKEKYYLGDYRPSSLEAGRFSEIILRMLQKHTTNTYTPLGQQLPNFVNEIRKLEQLPKANFHESIRIQIPRTLQVIYDIRNKRDIGHVGKEISANYTDATMSSTSCSWVLAELFRLFNVTNNLADAQKMVNSIVKYNIPIIQDFNGFKKILNTKLTLKQKILVILYTGAEEGYETKKLILWLKNVGKQQIYNALNYLEHTNAFIHRDESQCYITDAGRKFAEKNIEFKLN